MWELFDIKRLKTKPYHPQCEGLSERFIQTLKKMITGYINQEQTNWDHHLNKLAYEDLLGRLRREMDQIHNQY
jgi:hypothetical protein